LLDVLYLVGDPIRADAGPDRTAECASPDGTPVTLDGSGSTGPDLRFHWSAPGVSFEDPGAPKPTGLFPAGISTVTLRVTSGVATVMDQTQVTVMDTGAPTLALMATPSVLWPPNGVLANISVAVDAHDGCDPHPAVRLLSVTSSEPDTSTEQGDVASDIVGAETGADDQAFSLRSERASNGPGRTYKACYEAKDASGNATVECVTITVPHDRSKRAELSADTSLAGESGHGAFAFSAAVRPNPAPRGASFALTLPRSGIVRVTIFDVAGNVVSRPVDGWRPAGRQVERLGSLRGPQVYWYRVEWQGRHIEGKFVTLR
jgi:hypothetical protein